MSSTMEIEEFLNKMQMIQKAFFELIEAKQNQETKYNDLINLLNKLEIINNPENFKLFLHLLAHIFSNHHCKQDFINYIKKILTLYKDNIKKFYSNSEIFAIFMENEKILLFLYESKIMIIDQYVFNHLEYFQKRYFFPEIKQFLSKEKIDEMLAENPKNFVNQRKSGTLLEQIFIEDSVEKFEEYSKKQEANFLTKSLKPSIFETSNFLLSKFSFSLIEYAAFYGSVNIFKYLLQKKVEITPYIWTYAIQSNSQEIIRILESTEIKPYADDCYNEAIKCHHNEMAKYFKSKYLSDKSIDISKLSLKSYNFEFVQKEMINPSVFHHLCCYDYISFVKILLQDQKIDLNAFLEIS